MANHCGVASNKIVPITLKPGNIGIFTRTRTLKFSGIFPLEILKSSGKVLFRIQKRTIENPDLSISRISN